MTDMAVTPSPSRRLPSAGSFSTFDFQGIGPAAGCAYHRAKSPGKIAALGTFLAGEDLPPGAQPECLLATRTPAAQRPTVAEEVERHPEVGGRDPN
jgi:hypothetical protein